VARLVAAEMKSLGFAVESDEMGNVVGTLDLGPGPVVLFDAHMDTVSVADPTAWTRDPRGEISDHRLYGRGAMDMKGPLASAIHGVAQCRHQTQGRLVVCATVSEELVEGPALIHVAQKVQPDAVVICEATSLRVAHGQRGRAEICIDVFGRATHSSRPELGINALDALCNALVALQDLPLPSHPVLGRAILVATDIASKPYPALSVVPDFATATLDRRTLPGESEDEIVTAIASSVNAAIAGTGARAKVAVARDDFTTYSGMRVSAPNFASAWFFPDSDPVVRTAVAGLARNGLASSLTVYSFCTNGSGTAGLLGIPTIGYGPGVEELAHRPDEHIEIDDLLNGARGYAAIATALIQSTT